MASLPPQRPASRQRQSSTQHEHAAHNIRTGSFGAASVDSQTLLLNSPHTRRRSLSHEPDTDTDTTNAQASAPSQGVATESHDEQDLKKCWICLLDETEDDATSSEWRSPCPCVLVAHEQCLLDWIADKEKPSAQRGVGVRQNITCPHCKGQIRLQRPTSLSVELVRAIDSFKSSLIVPGVAFAAGTALYTTLAFAGTQTIYTIFGTQDAMRILAPVYQMPHPSQQSLPLRLASHVQQHWRLDIGLPLIPTILIASRTSLADPFLPFLPLIFFASSGVPGEDWLRVQWPPSAACAFATLPYIRSLYNSYYERVWAPREQRWLQEVQPILNADTTRNGANNDDNNDERENARVLEFEVDLDIFGDWNNDDDDEDPEHRPQPDPNAQDNAAAPAPNVPPARRARAEANANVAFKPISLADTIFGALIFPSIAAAMGELLARTLPASWVTPQTGIASVFGWWAGGDGGKVGYAARTTGLLQTKWGRGLVGGCLFIGIKDAMLLYVKWKMAQNHRRRRVLDCDKGPRNSRGAAATSLPQGSPAAQNV